MTLIERMGEIVSKWDRPASATELAAAIERSRSTASITLHRSDWTQLPSGSWHPSHLSPALLTQEERAMLTAARTGDRRPYALTEREAAVIDAMRHT